MFYTIYQITNMLDGKIYIGKHQTKKLDDGYMGSGKVLRHAIAKYGIENFKKEILHVFDAEAEMNAKEAELVNEEFVGRVDTYNLCFGGNGGFGYINSSGRNILHQNRPEYKEKHKARMLNLHSDPDRSKIQSRGLRRGCPDGNFPSFAGRSHTEESKAKMRAANKQKGSQNSQFGSMWITNGSDNRKIKKDVDNIPEGWYKGRR